MKSKKTLETLDDCVGAWADIEKRWQKNMKEMRELDADVKLTRKTLDKLHSEFLLSFFYATFKHIGNAEYYKNQCVAAESIMNSLECHPRWTISDVEDCIEEIGWCECCYGGSRGR